MSMEDRLVQILHANYANSTASPVFIQSFEVGNLQYLNGQTDIRIAQLLSGGGQPFDFLLANDPRTYADLASPDGLDFVNDYADGVGANTSLMIPVVGGQLGTPTTLSTMRTTVGLAVHGWTFRAENAFLPSQFDIGADPASFGDMAGQIDAFFQLGMDGFFTDQPDLGVAAVAAIPEPETYALMLGGLGVIAWVARRRRARKA